MNLRVLWRVMVCACSLSGTAMLSAQMQAMAAASDFAYSGDKGPGFWDEINPACASTASSRQSPIDIDRVIPDFKLEPLHVISTPTVTELKNPGYTIVGTPANRATVAINGVTYTLVQFHFHTLSEHTVLGLHGVMELHAVFSDPGGTKLAVIGEIYRLGHANHFLEEVLANGLPQKSTSPDVMVEGVNLDDAFTDTASYFNYPGSLTTPPCSETVNWFVLQRWAELSEKQYEAMRKVLGNDFRPVQAKNGRTVRASVGRP